VALVIFVGTDRWFSILEDETTIVSSAEQQPAETMALFSHGAGQHEHPPLSDILLHYWLDIGGAAQWSLRLPSVVLFLCGLLVLALSARTLGGDAGFHAMLWLGLLWPFGFHFGRLAGWYSFCFFLVAVLTFIYLRFVARPTWARMAAMIVVSILLVYSNYYGWVLVGCLVFDMAAFRRNEIARKYPLALCLFLPLAYSPLWPI
jgi:hypothetical protein